MTNLFAVVATDPETLYRVDDPVGPENDRYILQAVTETREVVVAWGVLGQHQKRCQSVLKMLAGFDLMCLKETKEGYPIHPLYLARKTELIRYKQLAVSIVENAVRSQNRPIRSALRHR